MYRVPRAGVPATLTPLPEDGEGYPADTGPPWAAGPAAAPPEPRTLAASPPHPPPHAPEGEEAGEGASRGVIPEVDGPLSLIRQGLAPESVISDPRSAQRTLSRLVQSAGKQRKSLHSKFDQNFWEAILASPPNETEEKREVPIRPLTPEVRSQQSIAKFGVSTLLGERPGSKIETLTYSTEPDEEPPKDLRTRLHEVKTNTALGPSAMRAERRRQVSQWRHEPLSKAPSTDTSFLATWDPPTSASLFPQLKHINSQRAHQKVKMQTADQITAEARELTTTNPERRKEIDATLEQRRSKRGRVLTSAGEVVKAIEEEDSKGHSASDQLAALKATLLEDLISSAVVRTHRQEGDLRQGDTLTTLRALESNSESYEKFIRQLPSDLCQKSYPGKRSIPVRRAAESQEDRRAREAREAAAGEEAEKQRQVDEWLKGEGAGGAGGPEPGGPTAPPELSKVAVGPASADPPAELPASTPTPPSSAGSKKRGKRGSRPSSAASSNSPTPRAGAKKGKKKKKKRPGSASSASSPQEPQEGGDTAPPPDGAGQ